MKMDNCPTTKLHGGPSKRMGHVCVAVDVPYSDHVHKLTITPISFALWRHCPVTTTFENWTALLKAWGQRLHPCRHLLRDCWISFQLWAEAQINKLIHRTAFISIILTEKVCITLLSPAAGQYCFHDRPPMIITAAERLATELRRKWIPRRQANLE